MAAAHSPQVFEALRYVAEDGVVTRVAGHRAQQGRYFLTLEGERKRPPWLGGIVDPFEEMTELAVSTLAGGSEFLNRNWLVPAHGHIPKTMSRRGPKVVSRGSQSGPGDFPSVISDDLSCSSARGVRRCDQ